MFWTLGGRAVGILLLVGIAAVIWSDAR
jgi:hypothetical protein